MHHIAPLGPLILLLLGYFTSAVTVYLSLAVFILMSSHTLANAMPVSFVLQNSIFLGLKTENTNLPFNMVGHHHNHDNECSVYVIYPDQNAGKIYTVVWFRVSFGRW